MKAKNLLLSLAVALAGGFISVFVYATFFQQRFSFANDTSFKEQVKLASMMNDAQVENASFILAANKTVHSVVHVKTQLFRQQQSVYDFFFGQSMYSNPQPIVGTGSGVIISDDGYIVTNNHVIQNADKIEVVLNDKRSYEAKLVGTDRYMDIALLKIEETQLPFMEYGNSDDLMIGEWVLAVGNPFNLTSTVTAGIVSAKARNINANESKFAIESFIQTDAAVNPGNSGGALVDTKGNLVGINTAIASNTGAFTGYSFAVPVNMVKKVVADLIKFGEVQHAYLGVSIANIDAQVAKELKLDKIEGVLIAGVSPNGAASEAGLKNGDIILSIEDKPINAVSELHEQISNFRPGDKIKIFVKRDGKTQPFNVVLRNRQGNTDLVKNEFDTLLGGTFEDLTQAEKSKLRILKGVKISNLEEGKLKNAGIKEGFIITSINRNPVNSVKDVFNVLNSAEGTVLVEGVYPNGMVAYYAFGM